MAPKRSRLSTSKTKGFFEVRLPQSEVKAQIILEFFKAWASIIYNTLRGDRRLGYVDLYAGRGYYDRCARDESLEGPIPSTPLMILAEAISNPNFAASLVSIFNEGDPDKASQLEKAIANLPGIDKLRFKPHVIAGDVSVGEFAKRFEAVSLIPTFMFLDPFGYKGLTRDLIKSVLKNWACDVAFFFDYSNINRGLGTDIFDAHLEALFGADRLNRLRATVSPIENPLDREEIVLKELREALHEIGGRHFIPYRFRDEFGRTSHHLVFTSKRFKGYHEMRKAIAKSSDSDEDGIPYYEFVAPSKGVQSGLFAQLPPRHFPYTMRWLEDDLVARYGKGSRLTFEQLFENHSAIAGWPYLERHYRTALWHLVDRRRVDLFRDGKPYERRFKCPPETEIRFIP